MECNMLLVNNKETANSRQQIRDRKFETRERLLDSLKIFSSSMEGIDAFKTKDKDTLMTTAPNIKICDDNYQCQLTVTIPVIVFFCKKEML